MKRKFRAVTLLEVVIFLGISSSMAYFVVTSFRPQTIRQNFDNDMRSIISDLDLIFSDAQAGVGSDNVALSGPGSGCSFEYNANNVANNLGRDELYGNLIRFGRDNTKERDFIYSYKLRKEWNELSEEFNDLLCFYEAETYLIPENITLLPETYQTVIMASDKPLGLYSITSNTQASKTDPGILASSSVSNYRQHSIDTKISSELLFQYKDETNVTSSIIVDSTTKDFKLEF